MQILEIFMNEKEDYFSGGSVLFSTPNEVCLARVFMSSFLHTYGKNRARGIFLTSESEAHLYENNTLLNNLFTKN